MHTHTRKCKEEINNNDIKKVTHEVTQSTLKIQTPRKGWVSILSCSMEKKHIVLCVSGSRTKCRELSLPGKSSDWTLWRPSNRTDTRALQQAACGVSMARTKSGFSQEWGKSNWPCPNAQGWILKSSSSCVLQPWCPECKLVHPWCRLPRRKHICLLSSTSWMSGEQGKLQMKLGSRWKSMFRITGLNLDRN